MAKVMLESFDVFLRNKFWCTGVQTPRFSKWLWILNGSKSITVVWPRHSKWNQFLLNKLLSIDHSSRYKMNVYKMIITRTSVVVSRPGLGLGLGLKTIFWRSRVSAPWSWSRIAKVSVLSRSRNLEVSEIWASAAETFEKTAIFKVFVGDS